MISRRSLMDKTIRICHLSEGIAGHNGQVLGVIKTLKDAGFTISVQEVSVNWSIRSLRSILRIIARKFSRFPNSFSIRLIQACYKLGEYDEFDMVISSGSNLAPINLALAKRHHAKNIHMSSIRDWRVEDFSAYITTTQVSFLPNNLRPKIVPNQFDPASCEELGKKFIQEKNIQDTKFSLLVIGGDGIGYEYHNNEWEIMIEQFINFCKNANTQPLFITSRRTPQHLESKLISNYDSPYSVYFHAEQRRGSFHHLLYMAKHIFVTEDSSTMISEAISSGKSVITIFPKTIRTPRKYSDIIDKYQRLNFIERRSLRVIQTTDFTRDRGIANKVQKAHMDFQKSLVKRLELD
jgi:mitochondrial fission protein ELM1